MSTHPPGRSARPAVVVFDVLDTLFPLAPLEWRFREAGIPRVLMGRWADHLSRDVFALALVGGDRSFEDVVRGALRDITGHQIAPGAEDAIFDGLSSLEPRREAAAALTAVREAGLRAVALGNTDPATTAALVGRAGLEGLLGHLGDGGPDRVWKPAPAAYLGATRSLGVAPGRIALVTAHGWDVAGAARAGWVTGWSAHLEGRFPAVFGAPDATGGDLAETVAALLAPPGP
ncbi:HAD family hydrolase [Nocardiopsis lambiniae]|uniref:HAD family hydrolase n=1 Tax=Nocardiopsis lambiniae TaxID=3075539 RepID=A0ABU2M3C3_9ACTN|nr:HAD family hydrolase [Nocardiopsis sp. DSM 44743]MDT0327102.1 HAD family hydrolase [Nocardiopsis sp. DSM 44743]